MKFGDVGQRISGHRDDVGVFAFFNGSDLVLPTQHFGVGQRSGLNGACRRHSGVLHQPFILVPLNAVRKRIVIHAAAHEDLQPFCRNRSGDRLFKDRDDPEFTARSFLVVVVHQGNRVTDERRGVIELLLDHFVDLRL